MIAVLLGREAKTIYKNHTCVVVKSIGVKERERERERERRTDRERCVCMHTCIYVISLGRSKDP
jgi:hypothetical protein